jgi:hypothetical protein
VTGSVGDARRAPTDVAAPELSDAARAGYVGAYDAARAAGDIDAMTAAALGLAATQTYGTFPGRVPAFLHEAYSLARGEQRAQLAVAVARAWAYGGDPARAVEFAAEALAFAESREDSSLLAHALDAELLVHWGPDDLDERLRITARLEDVVAHVTDVEARLSAHLWRLTTALECLDVTAVRRQLRSLDVLAEESQSPRVRFFAASRQGMFALLTHDLDAAAQSRQEATAAGTEAGEADTYAIARILASGIARQSGDIEALTREATIYEEFGTREAITSITAESAVLWTAAGQHAHARALLHQLAGSDFSAVPRDVDWPLTMTSLTEVAAATGVEDLAGIAVSLLEPYAGRGVVNGGGAAFAGVVDDCLYRASQVLGRHADADRWRASATGAYQRMGATWWLARLPPPGDTRHRSDVVHLRPGADGIWWVGRDGDVTTVRDMKGLHYLRLVLQRPDADVPALDLSDTVAGHPQAGLAPGTDNEVLDRKALLSYRRRLGEIDADLDEAHAWSDAGRTARLEEERDALLAQLRSAVGLGGRRRTEGATTERARVAVRKAVASALDRIAAVDPSLARLLRDTVRTGTVCRYAPDPDRPTHWVLSD